MVASSDNPDNEVRSVESLSARLEAAQRRLRFLEAVINELPNPIFVKNDQGQFYLFNKAYEDFFEMKQEDFLNLTVLDLDYLSLEERERYHREDMKAINQGLEVHYETSYNAKGGIAEALYWSKGIVEPVSGKKGLVGTIVDISRQKHLEQDLTRTVKDLEAMQEQLRILAQTDALTGLHNRRHFDARLGEVVSISTRYSLPFCLVMADIDYFKKVNDNFGHDAGDKVLKDFAAVLLAGCRSGDYVMRFGGEEFVLILPMTSKHDARVVSERIRTVAHERCVLPDGSYITVSLGVAEFIKGESPDQLIKRADDALYQAKANGRNQVVVA
ncbi:MAG: diguanylate cyclase [Desulfovibrionaceae bacterium]|nr:diguanylate cyclase [Desulfovibrionaceae bacterium]